MKNTLPFLALCFLATVVLTQPGYGNAVDPVLQKKLLRLKSTLKKLQGQLNSIKNPMNELEKIKDELSELSEADMFYLQSLMDQKSQLEQMISNVVKAAGQAQAQATFALKAS